MAATVVCASCQDPLVIALSASDTEDEDGGVGGSSSTNMQDTETVPDDVHLLSCNCHFHWQCLLDAYEMTSCPSCSSSILSQTAPSAKQQILCDLNNEGGLQKSYDIFPVLKEESYLKAFPEERKARAFLELCRNGDVPGIVELLKDEDDQDEDEDAYHDDEEMMDDVQQQHQAKPQIDILRYQDPIGDKQSGLHYAVAAGSREVAWLLLLLASTLDLQTFPALVFQEAEAFGIMRDDDDLVGKPDIRSLQDANGRYAEDYAVDMVNPWRDWIGKGYLKM